jgi:hypothetical protein
MCVVVALIAVPVAAFNYLFGGPDTSSPFRSESYQKGYQDGSGFKNPELIDADQICGIFSVGGL